MIKRALCIIAIAFFSHSAVFADSAPRISDDIVIKYLTSTLSLPYRGLLFGRITVRSNLASQWSSKGAPKGELSEIEMGEAWYKKIQAGAQLGLLSIVRDPAMQSYKSGQSFDFKTFSEQGTAGLVDRVIVTPTEEGKKFVTSDNFILTVSGGRVDAIKIVKTDYRQIGLDNYAIVFFTLHADYPEIYVKVLSAAESLTLKSERKGIILWKYDLFANTWKPEPGFDVANADEQFRFNRVQNRLMQLSSGQPQ